MEPNEKQLFSNRALVTMIWPLLVEHLLSVLVGMVDVLMVAVLGETAVSGVSLIDSVNNLVLAVLLALAAGGTVVCSKFIGGEDYKNSRKTSGQLILLTLFCAVLVTSLFLVGGRSFLGLMFGQVETAVMDNAEIYMRLTCLSFPCIALYNSGFSLFRSIGDSKTAMKISLGMNLLNIAGNAFCIFVLKMGVEGVAIPTLLSRMIGAGVSMLLLHRSDDRIRVSGLHDFYPNRQIIRQCLGIGIPNGIESGIFQFGKLTLQSLVSTLGTASIAGYAVACNLVTYLYLPGNALCICMLTVIGQCVGAGYQRQARENCKKLVICNYLILLVVCSICLIFKRNLVGLYNLSMEASVIAEDMFFQHILWMVIWPLGFLMPSYFRANNQPKFPMVVSIAVMWIFRICGAYIFVRYLNTGVRGIWYAMFIDWIVRMILLMGKYWLDGRKLKIAEA